MRFVFYFLSLLWFPSVLFAQENRPNILLIIADDLGIDAIEGFGLMIENRPATPNLQALQVQGLTYTNTWATPQCTPTRAAIMSGKYGIKTGVMRPPGNLDLEHESIFSYINRTTNDAYSTAVIGKWHISNPVDLNHPMAHGVDHFEGVIRGTIDDYYGWEKVENGVTTQETEYITTHLTNSAIDWIEAQEQPWFLWLSHIAPHGPFQLPPDGLYSLEDPTSDRQLYQASIEALDHEIGRLLDSMTQSTRENTLIIFIGDNGTPSRVMDYFPNRHGKGTMFEGGLRVPMILSGAGVDRPGEQEAGLTQAVDLYATLIEITSHTLQGGIHNSYSLKASLSQPNTLESRKYIYSDYRDGETLFWAIKNDRYKLIEDSNGSQEFYRIEESLAELDNLIASLSEEEMAILAELEAEANIIRADWSCQDLIQNGTETAIDSFGNVGGCPNESAEDTLTSIYSLPNTTLRIFPNPTLEIVHIEVQDQLRFIASLYNLEGKRILQQRNPTSISLLSVVPGTYILEIQDLKSGQKIVEEIIKRD
ncbi:MAG: sulfatase-like hydrolase/transferase [Bacteroidota bacterium]